jgi:glycosyltransferase involved in cell wall biosynthesis
MLKRVLHVIPRLDAAAGGTVSAMIGQAQAQARGGLHVEVAAAWSNASPVKTCDALQQVGVAVHPIGPVHTSLGWGPATRREVGLLAHNADVVHIHTLFEDIQHQTAGFCRQVRKPYIFHPCGMLDPWSLRQKSLKKKLYMAWRLRRDLDRATAIHVASAGEREQTALLGLKAPLVVVPNGIETREFEDLPAKGQFRGKYRSLDGRPLVVFLGRVHPGKGVELLLPALARMQHRDAMLAVVGPDSRNYLSQMRAEVQRLGLEDRVVFTGMMPGRSRIEALVDADVFALPSEHENFGIAVLEALAAGAPVVISDQVGICQEVTEARVGQAVPLDVDRLTAALDEWLNDAPRRTEAGHRARELVFNRFTWDQIAQRWNEVYRALGIC